MIFVTATDTDVGKTYFSKSLINFLIENNHFKQKEIAYFKAVQCGRPSDFDEIKKETGVDIYCSYDLSFPASPDYAASLENVEIDLEKIKADFQDLQSKYKFIIVEGAGGVAVPFNNKDLVSDLAKLLGLETILVIRPDLGTINHSITAVEHLQNKGVKLKGLFVSAKTRDISEAYEIDQEKKDLQNSAALESIIKFTRTKIISFDDLV